MNEEAEPLRDEAALHAYVDGRLDTAARAVVEAWLQADPGAARTAASWAAQRQALRGLHADVLDEPAPAPLVQAGQRLAQGAARRARWQRWGGMAAAVIAAFGLGWSGHGLWRERQPGAAVAQARGTSEFARQALLAHAVYLPEQRHPVEVEAAQQEHLVQWLSRRLGRPLKVPDLSGLGYTLVGGRLLPGEKGARAQFMYQSAAGERITLYLGAVDPAPGLAETAFRFTVDGPVASFYWVDQGFGYALAGKLPRQRLLGLAEAVYSQL